MIRTTLVSLSAALALTACVADDGDDTLASVDFDLKVADCAALPAPFSQNGCPNPATMTNDQKKAQCRAVKTAALAKATNKDCSDGWIFGPNTELEKCLGTATGKKLCKLSANDPGPGHAAWPAGDGWSQCLNDWVVYCTDNFPAEMGIGAAAPVCFVPSTDFDRLPANSVTGREVCQRVKDGALPGKCDADICKPKPKARVVPKKRTLACTTTPTTDADPTLTDTPLSTAPINAHVATTDAPTETCVETWVEEACAPNGDDCVAECEPCADDDTDPACIDEDACYQAIEVAAVDAL